MTNKNLPFLLQTALLLLPSFVLSLKWARPGAIRAMRPERRNAILKVLEVFLHHCSLQHNGAFCAISAAWVRPLTIEEIAKLAGLKFHTVERVLEDLRDLGLIISDQIKRKNPQTGRLEVSPGLRFFTREFWEKLGLWDKFLKSCEWAKENCKRFFNMPFKTIATKAKSTVVEVKTVVKGVIKSLQRESLRQ